VRVFIDTNLWVYRLDRREREKSTFISQWLREQAIDNEIVISTQVLIELRSVIMRKLKPALSWHDTQAALAALAGFEVVPANANLVLDAHGLAAAEKLSWFDALIAEAALRSGCALLYSEDLDHGRLIGDMRISNPFNQGSS